MVWVRDEDSGISADEQLKGVRKAADSSTSGHQVPRYSGERCGLATAGGTSND